jgi:hypothetical protein
VESDSRVRATACFIRLKRLELASGTESGAEFWVSFLPPKSFIIKGVQL